MPRPPHSAIVAASTSPFECLPAPPQRGRAQRDRAQHDDALGDRAARARARRLLERTLAGARRRVRRRRPTRCSRAPDRTGTAPAHTPIIAGSRVHRPCSEIATGISTARSGMPISRTGTSRPMRSETPRTPLAMCIQTAVESYARSLCGSQPRNSATNGNGHERDDLEQALRRSAAGRPSELRRSGSRGGSRCSDGRGTST